MVSNVEPSGPRSGAADARAENNSLEQAVAVKKKKKKPDKKQIVSTAHC